jgi:3-deoxy-D-manno-octulosonic-acid transferase
VQQKIRTYIRLYTTLLWLVEPFMWFRYYWLGRNEPAYRLRWAERRGHVPKHFAKGAIWIHAVSLGEGVAGIALFQALKKRYPDHAFLFTTGTPMASMQVTKHLGNAVDHMYLPFDKPLYIRRFLDALVPRLLLLIESELWPNLLLEVTKKEIPWALMNARVSPRTKKRYIAFSNLMLPWVKVIQRACLCVGAQSESDKAVFLSLGFPQHKVHRIGNLKADGALLGLTADQNTVFSLYQRLKTQRFIWVAGSTRPGEEEILLQGHRALLKECPEALLIIVPRHPQRGDFLEALLREKKYSYQRRSVDTAAAIGPKTEVYLADTVGELLIWYALAHCAFVGGSLVPGIGGHSVVEPAGFRIPILLGPYAAHVLSMAQELHARGALTWVIGPEEILQVLQGYYHDRLLMEQNGEQAGLWVEEQQGVCDRAVDLLDSCLETQL